MNGGPPGPPTPGDLSGNTLPNCPSPICDALPGEEGFETPETAFWRAPESPSSCEGCEHGPRALVHEAQPQAHITARMRPSRAGMKARASSGSARRE